MPRASIDTYDREGLRGTMSLELHNHADYPAPGFGPVLSISFGQAGLVV